MTEVIASMHGVLVKVNKLNVVPTEAIADKQIAKLIRDAIDRSGGVDAEYITISVGNGTVTLDGKIRDWNNCYGVEYAARNTLGVKEFMNNMMLT